MKTSHIVIAIAAVPITAKLLLGVILSQLKRFAIGPENRIPAKAVKLAAAIVAPLQCAGGRTCRKLSNGMTKTPAAAPL